jgi:WD40 repeat protein
MLRNDETNDWMWLHIITHTSYITGLYSEPEGTALCVLEGHRGGVTHLKFSPDGMVLYSGGRKDSEILWYVYDSILPS